MSSRNAAVAIMEALGEPGVTVEKGRVTAVHAGPPKTVDVRINDEHDVPGLRYTPPVIAVDNAVYVLRYGAGKRVVFGVEQ